MLIEWSLTAEQDLVEALTWFVEQGDIGSGQKIVTRLFASTDRLATFPNSGRPGLIAGTRELVLPDIPYFLIYRVARHVEIMRVIHTSKLWTGDL